MTRKVLDALKMARDLISPFERWTQGNAAIDDTGAECEVLGHNACAWCADGALAAGSGGFSTTLYVEARIALNRAARRTFPDTAGIDCHFPYVAVNDAEAGIPAETMDALSSDEISKLAHENVIKLFDVAIAEASS